MAENHDSTISLRNTFKRQANQVASIEAIEVDTDTDVNLNTVIHPVVQYYTCLNSNSI